MNDEVVVAEPHADEAADREIIASLNLDRPVSFFLFADAGSGKTRSLVTALEAFRKTSGRRLRLQGRRVGVITYTNAACDEITRRLEFDPLITVSTIHSFVWSLIENCQSDIREWLRKNLALQISELEELQRKGRAGSKAAMDRAASIKSKEERRRNLDVIRRFTYNPSGDNRGRDSLNHAEVIQMGASFLSDKVLMQSILASKFPIVLVDESQDTNKALMEALLAVQEKHKDRFCLGLFGDTMQRIYGDGKEDLGQDLPVDWARPTKKLNHRSPRRVIRLINKIRSTVDAHKQMARLDSPVGFVRFFVLPAETRDKTTAERSVNETMAKVTGDPLWNSEANVKRLVLEHHMAARRMGFSRIFDALNGAASLQTGLRDGSLPGLRFFSKLVLPLVTAKTKGDDCAVAAIVRSFSPLLARGTMKTAQPDQRDGIRRTREATAALTALCMSDPSPRFLDVLRFISQTRLFDIPDSLQPFADERNDEGDATSEGDSYDAVESDTVLRAWGSFLEAPFTEIVEYDRYVSGLSPFETHQGVKGLEFARVSVVIDDTEARGFSFGYDKLFGAKAKSSTDLQNEREGRDSVIERTRRLFYVTCSRAKESLAIIAYTSNPQHVSEHVVRQGWFDDNEVEVWT